jgi:acetoin utilization protein AcuC
MPTIGHEQARPVFISHRVFEEPGYNRQHPLAIARVGAVGRICRLLGWLDESNYRECEPASFAALSAFHDGDYLTALRRVGTTGQATPEDVARFRLGTMENPVFPRLFERVAASVGGAVLAARLALQGRIAFHPGGGTHHGRPDRASGFCYSNDPVFAVREFLQNGLCRVAYVDLDAHHGDGVEDALAGDGRCLTISVHEAGRWPGSGTTSTPHALNFPVARGFGDAEFKRLMAVEVLPALRRFAPQAVVLTCGADCLAGDPLSAMRLSNQAVWDGILAIIGHSSRAVVLGGGGYNPWTTVRYWTGLWGSLNGWPIPARLPPAAEDLLRSFSCDLVDDEDIAAHWFTTIADGMEEPVLVEGMP